jgi:hypothetical protein
MAKNNIDSKMIERVTLMLAGYKDLQVRAQQLAFEIKNYTPMASGEDMIDAMTFGKPADAGSTHVHTSKITDKTASTAIAYEANAAALNSKQKKDLEYNLRVINMEMMRLEYYISLLDENYAKTLRMLYIEGLTYVKIADELKTSISSVRNFRKVGIRKLAVMFQAITA